jgi:N-carbamoyl-L-amino-acid hydrolase
MNLPLSPDRLWDRLMEMAKIGPIPGGGNNRQALSALDGEARALLRRWGEEIGLTVTVDRLGNMALRREGRDPRRKPVLVGSHLDTQPTGGKFDGPYGVLAGLEILHALHESGTVTEAPIVLVNWTGEEGSRFSPSMIGAAGAMGILSEAEVLAAQAHDDGEVYGDALKATGWAGKANPTELAGAAAYFDAHIEQGPVLEREGYDLGIVTGGFATERALVTVTGETSHAGTTPMEMRRDALLGTAEMMSAAEAILHRIAPEGRMTVCRFMVDPGADGVVPGEVRFSFDYRHPSNETLDRLLSEADAAFAGIAARRNLAVKREPYWTRGLRPGPGRTPARGGHAQQRPPPRHALRRRARRLSRLRAHAGGDALHSLPWRRQPPSERIHLPRMVGEGLAGARRCRHRHREFQGIIRCVSPSAAFCTRATPLPPWPPTG